MVEWVCRSVVLVDFQIGGGGGFGGFSDQKWWWVFKLVVVFIFLISEIGSGVNVVFGCVDGGGWVVVSVLVGLIGFVKIKNMHFFLGMMIA